MRTDRKYLVAVVLLAVLAVAFGVFGTIAPPLAEEGSPVQPQQESSSDSLGHFQNPPTYDSGWVDIRNKTGEYFSLTHDLQNVTQAVVDVSGKQSLNLTPGALEWNRTFGRYEYDENPRCVVQTSDGGYAITGYTNFNSAGSWDAMLIRTDSTGQVYWSKTYGASNDDGAYAVIQTSDGGYALAGSTKSYGASYYDFWLIKTDSFGNTQWNRTYSKGSSTSEEAFCEIQTSDGGYALAGSTYSYSSGYTIWLVKTDSSGTIQWERNDFGLSYTQIAYSVIQTSDGGYALAGKMQWPNGWGGYSYFLLLLKTNSTGHKQVYALKGEHNAEDYGQCVIQTSDGGYAVAGRYGRYSGAWLVKFASNLSSQWDQKYGLGSGEALARSVVQTSDGGYALGGYAHPSGGNFDTYLVKTNSAGTQQWNNTYGGPRDDDAFSLIKTSDGGYALAVATKSFSDGSYTDAQLVKTDVSGNKQWDKVYGALDDTAYSVVQTNDGGYALAGSSERSYGGYYYDIYLVKTDSSGNQQWKKTYAATVRAEAYSLVQTKDGGYALAGCYYNSPPRYDADFYLIKTDSSGNKEWEEIYGAGNDEVAYSLIQTEDNGYALAGYSDFGDDDIWLVKTDSLGNLQWHQYFGEWYIDQRAYSLVQTSEGGYALAGMTGNMDYEDFYVIKTNSTGGQQWTQTFAGDYSDIARSILQTSDGGFAIAGSTQFFYYDTCFYDFWLIKTDSGGRATWNKTYGTLESNEKCYSFVQTEDEGYALAGYTPSFGTFEADFWLVRTDQSGNAVWNKTYGGIGTEVAYSIFQTRDLGFALAGYTADTAGTNADFYLIRASMEIGYEHKRNFGTDTGLVLISIKNSTILLYRGSTDPYWNYVRVRIWLIKEPSWIYGDINMDGVVDAKDLYIIGRNYGKTFSLLSLTGIIAVAGIRTVKKRKQPKQPSYIS